MDYCNHSTAVKLGAHPGLWWHHEVTVVHAACFVCKILRGVIEYKSVFFISSEIISIIPQQTVMFKKCNVHILGGCKPHLPQTSHSSACGGVVRSVCALFPQQCGGRRGVSGPSFRWLLERAEGTLAAKCAVSASQKTTNCSAPQTEPERALNFTHRWYQRHVRTAWASQRI